MSTRPPAIEQFVRNPGLRRPTQFGRLYQPLAALIAADSKPEPVESLQDYIRSRRDKAQVPAAEAEFLV
jgi:hypothetical protein